MTAAPLVVVGDSLLDRDLDGSVERLSPEAPVPVLDERASHARPGGAALAAALAAARSGREVTLVTALGRDRAGEELAAALAAAGVEVADLGLHGPTPEKVRLRADGRTLLRIDRGGPGGPGSAPAGPVHAGARAALSWAPALLVSDYGRGIASSPEIRRLVAARAGEAPLVWDPHPRGQAPVRGAALVTPNQAEAAALDGGPPGDGVEAIARRAERLRERWRAQAVCVTRGERGALLATGGAPLVVLADAVTGGDPCGAGDCFAAAAAAALADGTDTAGAVLEAVGAASRFVAGGGADAALSPAPAGEDLPPGSGLAAAHAVIAGVRARGGTVVAAGGCFDLLHTGHVATLRAARALGDCLVVCLNSDRSVRALKGPGRPVVPEQDRAAVLLALRCVDAVVLFDEQTPHAVLADLRPDVWAKGGDYAGVRLPEAELLESWGGSAVVLPRIGGRSTTRLIKEAADRAGT